MIRIWFEKSDLLSKLLLVRLQKLPKHLYLGQKYVLGEGSEHAHDKSPDFGLIFVELVWEEVPIGPILV